MYAVMSGHIETVETLLECNADVNVQDIDGRTALCCIFGANALNFPQAFNTKEQAGYPHPFFLYEPHPFGSRSPAAIRCLIALLQAGANVELKARYCGAFGRLEYENPY